MQLRNVYNDILGLLFMEKPKSDRGKRIGSKKFKNKFEIINDANKNRLFEKLSKKRGYFSVATVDRVVSDIFLVRDDYKIFKANNKFEAEKNPFNIRCLITPTNGHRRKSLKYIDGGQYLGDLEISGEYKCALSIPLKLEEVLFYNERESYQREFTFKFHRAGCTFDFYNIDWLVRDQLRWAMQKITEHVNYLRSRSDFSYEPDRLDDDGIIENITKGMILARRIDRNYKPELAKL